MSAPSPVPAVAPTALLLSPHLDDVAFSCGGLAALLSDRGWRTVLATAFTASVPGPTGFALACQLDKGLDASVDYMALRRGEDVEATRCLGLSERRCLDLPEAPHRGYGSVAALFGPPRREDDGIVPLLAGRLRSLADELRPDLVLLPQGLGGHVDHLQLLRAARLAGLEACAFYRDTPYVIRNPDARPDPALDGLDEVVVPIGTALERKLAASCAYRSQLGFQFGGPEQTAQALRELAGREGRGVASERFLLQSPGLLERAA